MSKFAQIFNTVAEKIKTPVLVTRKAFKCMEIPVMAERPWNNRDFTIQGTVYVWYEARPTGNNEYKIFKIIHQTHKEPGISHLKPETRSVYRNPKNKTHFFTTDEAIKNLAVLEARIMREQGLQIDPAPKSWGVFRRYYK